MEIINTRPNFIDWAKVLGIYMVIVGHYVYCIELPFVPYEPIWNITHAVCLFHMPFFFFVSGMLYKYKEQNSFLQNMIRNIRMLIIPAVFLSLIACIIYHCFVDTRFNTGILKSYIIAFITGSDFFGRFWLVPSSPLWFVYSLFCIKTYMDFTSWLRSKGYKNISIVMVGLPMIIALITLKINHEWLPFRLDSSSTGYLFFIVGVYFIKFKLQNVFLSNSRKYYTFIITLIIVIVLYFLYLDNGKRQGLSINASYFGEIQPLFIFSGFSGTLMMLSIGIFLEKYKYKFVEILSNGMIVTLGIHKALLYLFKGYITCNSVSIMLLVSIFVLFATYIMILCSAKYFPFLLGNRKIN